MTAPRITIAYCTQCQWLLRAAWMAQELLSTFGPELDAVELQPRTGGLFRIHYNDVVIWDRKHDGGFPDAAVLKQRVRDQLDPDRDLGHVDKTRHKVDSGGAAADRARPSIGKPESNGQQHE